MGRITWKSINFARNIIETENKVINIIQYARKLLLFHNGNTWVKKEGNPLFDVTMGSYNGAKVSALVRLYLLSKLMPLTGTKKSGFMGMTA